MRILIFKSRVHLGKDWLKETMAQAEAEDFQDATDRVLNSQKRLRAPQGIHKQAKSELTGIRI